MFLSPYYTQTDAGVEISAEQASQFAKGVAQDFNPIHDPDNKRFCVPGDLLFALTLGRYGLSQSMNFRFEGMVGANAQLQFPQTIGSEFGLKDTREKQYLSMQREGEVLENPAVIEAFIRNYVAFSGHNFTDVVLPLMQRHQVMVNPARPLVIYESMGFDLEHLNLVSPELELVNTELEIQGKRGDATLEFAIKDAGVVVGTGRKTLVLSGLREICPDAIDNMCTIYAQRQQSYRDGVAV
ncbi:DUF3581 domain-containing protein [Paraferrimonas sedimenticola]|uniref:DUF3581 domain-containing protein n=1 Tax=Paraferrimonas sedimenticola TaxID=375674 RepID=A0AA37W176_9GAMM|nr:DUF3581 domain-containing protein [Paraferrimonas sedimenticola]GLP96553.1 hypothetical protein GCM10007895_18590 [Paraferrimonas sedimenticola]